MRRLVETTTFSNENTLPENICMNHGLYIERPMDWMNDELHGVIPVVGLNHQALYQLNHFEAIRIDQRGC